MSLRDKNTSLVVTGAPKTEATGGLRVAARQAVARPTTAAQVAIQKASIAGARAGNGNLGFVIDATGSREDTWAEAQSIQSQMFENTSSYGSGLKLKLVHFGGGEITPHEWERNSKAVAATMEKVRCRSGSTQIIDGLNLFLKDQPAQMANSIIVIGDSFEEDFGALKDLAGKLAEKSIRVFTFLEGSNNSAETAFKALSQITGGTFANFGANMPLADLCEGVARLTVGGLSALHALRNPDVAKLLGSTKLLAAPKF